MGVDKIIPSLGEKMINALERTYGAIEHWGSKAIDVADKSVDTIGNAVVKTVDSTDAVGGLLGGIVGAATRIFDPESLSNTYGLNEGTENYLDAFEKIGARKKRILERSLCQTIKTVCLVHHRYYREVPKQDMMKFKKELVVRYENYRAILKAIYSKSYGMSSFEEDRRLKLQIFGVMPCDKSLTAMYKKGKTEWFLFLTNNLRESSNGNKNYSIELLNLFSAYEEFMLETFSDVEKIFGKLPSMDKREIFQGNLDDLLKKTRTDDKYDYRRFSEPNKKLLQKIEKNVQVVCSMLDVPLIDEKKEYRSMRKLF